MSEEQKWQTVVNKKKNKIISPSLLPYDPIISRQKETFENRINYKPAPTTTSIKPEPVQRPVSVPRYDINNEEMPKSQFPMSNQNQNQNDKKVDSIIENKLKGVTTGTPEKTPPVPDAPRKYAVDPYREPTE